MGNENIDLITHNYSELPIERYGYNGGICAMDAKLVQVGPGSGYYRLHYAKETKTVKTTRNKLYGHRDTVSSQASSFWLNFCAKFALLCTQTEDRSSDYYSHVHVTGCTGRDVLLTRIQTSFRPFSEFRPCDNPCTHVRVRDGHSPLYLPEDSLRRSV